MLEKFCLIFILIQCVVGVNVITRDSTLVETNVGQIRGRRATDGNYTMFTGIPFATVDKNNPFGLSTPYPKFVEIFDAIEDAVSCPQLNNMILMSLDCLQLNVYVPDSASSSNPLPVLIKIHGGGYSSGSGTRSFHGPAPLVRHDVIVVTINYRLGPYGFMCLHTPEIPGNQGLKDQVLALKWIKENIKFFGGDVNKMTVFGQSVGAASIHLHLLSPYEDLFNNAILHSGTAYIIDLIKDPDEMAPIKIAAQLGFVTSDRSLALSFLSTAETDKVIQGWAQSGVEFWPCVEKDIDGVEKFVTDRPINVETSKIRGKNILLGYTDDEMVMVYSHLPEQAFPQIRVIESFLTNNFNFPPDRLQKMIRVTNNFYLGSQQPSKALMHEVTDFHSDFLFVYPTYRSIATFLNNGANSVYQFKFSYIGGRNLVRLQANVPVGVGGAAHTDEMGYLFDMDSLPNVVNLTDQLLMDRMTTMWTNFVKYGNPVPETTTLLPVKWEPITSNDLENKYLDIGLELSTGINPFHKRMAYWDLFFETQQEYQLGYKVPNSGVYFKLQRIYFAVALLSLLLL